MRFFASVLALLFLAGASSTYTVGDKVEYKTTSTPSDCTAPCTYSDGTYLYFRNADGFDTTIGAFGAPATYALTSRAAGSYYLMGSYEWASTSVSLTQATTQTWGDATVGHNSYAGAVTSAAGTTDGSCSLVVTGATYDLATGTVNGADSETLIADVTTASANALYYTEKLWLGTVTYDLVLGAGTTCALTFNYGFSRPEDGGKFVDLEMNVLRCEGQAGANDTNFEIELILDRKTGWTYAASSFVPGPAAVDKLTTRLNGYSDLANGDGFTYVIGTIDILTQRAIDPTYLVAKGTIGEGFLIRVTTGAVNSIRNMVCFVFLRLGVQN